MIDGDRCICLGVHVVVLRRLLGEFLGTAILVATVVGSGIMGQELSDDLAIILILNMVATVAVLGVIIWIFGPVSGAHFNPVVTAVAVIRREMRASEGLGYIVLQFAGALSGVALANIMFGLPAWHASSQVRSGAGVYVGEVVATAGLLLVIGALTRQHRGSLGPVLVPAWIGAAYFFTASTSFANPAVTVGRSLTDTFAGIAPESVLPFIGFQIVGAAVGAGLTELLYPRTTSPPEPLDLPEAVHGR